MEQLSLVMNEAEAIDAGSYDQETSKSKVTVQVRKRCSGSIEDVIPEDLPVEVVAHRLSEEERLCPDCGAKMVEIGKEIHRWLKIIPPQYSVPKAIAHIMTQKFVMYSPLYRQEQEMQRAGLKLRRQTMSNWILHAANDWLKPIYDELHRQLCEKTVLHADETTLQVLKEPGKSAVSKSYMWMYRTSGDAEHPIVLYDYQPNRKAENAERFLEGFSGWLHADGYAGYHKFPGTIRVVGCWAHARRKFDEALNAIPKEMQADSTALWVLRFLHDCFSWRRPLLIFPQTNDRKSG